MKQEYPMLYNFWNELPETNYKNQWKIPIHEDLEELKKFLRNKMKITINLKGLEIDVEYIYYKAERCIRYDEDLAGYPGFPPLLSIQNVFHGGINIYNFINEMDWWQLIEEIILEELNKNEE